ncbi:ComEC/Rec2 family competence protein [Pseudoalteromonas umbrosa]|uniref:ComEC/Rec2 family competence protein n=1 Tax=Pseudoalteromonas umbrosa TaxID=3048489 RepID=UPI0024C26DAE|nr:MBL fold metallo-hydrolase [Pseudoalteromonas sp. B95]MDK1287425.1 MBL fold metallo-hydrolase [Pseudoalteromonas sp. B95]
MDLTKFTVLDIGHGNCSIIESTNAYTIIDAAQGSDVQNILIEKQIKQVDDLIISHSDKDHVGGAIAILLDDEIAVKRVHLNPDGIKSTDTWGDFRAAVAHSRTVHQTIVVTAMNSDSEDIVYPDYKLEVLAPSAVDCITGPGSTGISGKILDSNSMSIVLRLIHDGANVALIPGDMNGDTLEFLKNENKCLDAKILVFPHHGGKPKNDDPEKFAKELCEKVDPDLVLFSNSRHKHDNPIPSVISGVKSSNCGAYLACTQMSSSCCDNEAQLSNLHLSDSFPSKGKIKNHSCAGSVTIALQGSNTDINQPLNAHGNYVSNFPKRKCQ